MTKFLLESYKKKKHIIRSRLNEFKLFFNTNVVWNFNGTNIELINSSKTNEQRLFEELCFCLLTANTSAVMSAKAIDFLRNYLEQASLEEIQKILKKAGYRFPNIRAKYIIKAREQKLKLRELVLSNDKIMLREYLVENIKGLGYKESSHFLRNIGINGLAILDKHILRSMNEYRVIKEVPKTLNKKTYLKLEQKYLEFSKQLNINSDELDLLLWSIKSGDIIK